MKQISKSDWDEVTSDIAICTIPYSVSYIEKNFGLSFFEYEEDGLATCYGMYGQINDIKYFLRGYIDRKSTKLGITAYIRSFESKPNKALVELVNYFKIENSKLTWINEKLSPPKWGVLRISDNHKEVELYRFQSNDIAELYVKKNKPKNTKLIVRKV